jgi:uncharacterized surface protein with fasciclin (FAS1) repeats
VLGSVNASLINALQQGNHTVFAPSNDALASADLASIGNITNIFEYHIAAGLVNATSLNTTDTVIRTTLGAPTVVLPANQTQVLILDKLSNGTIHIQNGNTTATVVQNATYQNLDIWVIDSLLKIPGNIGSVFAATPDLSSLSTAIEGSFPNIIPVAAAVRGLTFFAPVNSAIVNAAAALTTANTTVLGNVLQNHVINGIAVYSPQITNGSNYTSAGGEPLTFTSNSTGLFVTSGSSTAKIIQTNLLTSNGVVHLIDTVLFNTANNTAAASSAYASATSAAAHTGQTGPVGSTTSNTATSTSTSTTSHSGSVRSLDFATPIKVVAGLVFGSLLGTSLL